MKVVNLASGDGVDWDLREYPKSKWMPAQVPGTLYNDLQKNNVLPDPFYADNEKLYASLEHKDWEYRCRFPWQVETTPDKEVELVFEGLDTLVEIHINGKKIAEHDNMHKSIRIPVGPLLLPGINELLLRFPSFRPYLSKFQKENPPAEWNDPVGGSSHLRKQGSSFGWDWGPRLPSCGIWLPVRLEIWKGNRLTGFRIRQEHRENEVTLHLTASSKKKGACVRYSLYDADNKFLGKSSDGKLVVREPKVWWPNGMGEQPLYRICIELIDKDEVIDRWDRKIGLRKLILNRQVDGEGETFRFVINGVPFFAKGANWIPAHSFPSEVTVKTYRDLLKSAVSANMNMLRVWGGGIYEREEFYDLCDELGILVWQDFMFACSTYPGRSDFLSSVKEEAEYQTQRLAHRPCLALWCGNNELEQRPAAILASKANKVAYEKIFRTILPEAVTTYDGETAYWPSSPHNPDDPYGGDYNNGSSGDAHYWGVWHGGRPIKNYENQRFRFCSEFGMQSFPSVHTAKQFCPDSELDPFSPIMDHHQKNPAGNRIILDYISQSYRFPKDYAALAYLSQLNQAHTMKTGVEHFRRQMPFCMGALYWQLNDCWPAVSWSSLEFGGRWKILHDYAKRFFAPLLISAKVHGDIERDVINGVHNSFSGATIALSSDPTMSKQEPAILASFRVVHTKTGEALSSSRMSCRASINESIVLWKKTADELLQGESPESVVLVMELFEEKNGALLARNTALFTRPRLMSFDGEKAGMTVTRQKGDHWRIQLVSKEYKHAVKIDNNDPGWHYSDNSIDLLPNEPFAIEAWRDADFPEADTPPVFHYTAYDQTYCH